MTEAILETKRLQLKAITPTLIHRLFNEKSKEEIISFFGFDEQGFHKYKDMHEKGMETYQLSFLFFLLIEKQTCLLANVVSILGTRNIAEPSFFIR